RGTIEMEKIKRMQSLILWVAWAILIGNSAAHADSFTFDTLPSSGDVAGPAGSTVGWGYTITNSALNDWLVMTGLSAGSFLNGTPDSSFFDFPILAPQTTLSVPFDPVKRRLPVILATAIPVRPAIKISQLLGSGTAVTVILPIQRLLVEEVPLLPAGALRT